MTRTADTTTAERSTRVSQAQTNTSDSRQARRSQQESQQVQSQQQEAAQVSISDKAREQIRSERPTPKSN